MGATNALVFRIEHDEVAMLNPFASHGAAPQPQWPKMCLSTRGQRVKLPSG